MSTTIGINETSDVVRYPPGNAASNSAVSWGAIFAGAAAAAALSLILFVLGTGLGMSAISPWSNEGIEAKTFGISGILWITLTSLAASGLGGYIAGRLRTRWISTPLDEVYFRDTAHGFLAWAVATLLTACLLTSTISAIVSGGVKAGAAIAGGAVASAGVAGAVAGANADNSTSDKDSTGYFVDSLFRKRPVTPADPAAAPIDPAAPVPAPALPEQDPGEVPAAEVARIFINALRNNSLPPADAQYLGQIVAEHTDLSQQEAEARVNETYNRWQTKMREAEAATKEAADEARKTTAYISLWLFVSLLIGAFTASWLATFGGRQRDL
jgi:hypothetical protein